MFASAWQALAFAYALEAQEAGLPPAPAYDAGRGARGHASLTAQDLRVQAALIRLLVAESFALDEYAYIIARHSGFRDERERALDQVGLWLRGRLQKEGRAVARLVARQYCGGGTSIKLLRKEMRVSQGRAIEFRREAFGTLDQLHYSTVAIAEALLGARGLIYAPRDRTSEA